MDLFMNAAQAGSAVGAPAWPQLPAEARAALTSLMAQLILDHAGKAAAPPAREAGHDL
jgi:acyl-CoA reductase-like NAD-dependent aldehyde dehydrogenase